MCLRIVGIGVIGVAWCIGVAVGGGFCANIAINIIVVVVAVISVIVVIP